MNLPLAPAQSLLTGRTHGAVYPVTKVPAGLRASGVVGRIVVILGIVVLVYFGIRMGYNAPAEIMGPNVSLSPKALPIYAALSTARVMAAYVLSLLFTLIYGYAAAYNKRAEKVLLPLLDVLQSVPILSFLPVVLLSLSGILPLRVATELAAIILITSQAWNMTFSWYQSLTTIPKELREAGLDISFQRLAQTEGP